MPSRSTTMPYVPPGRPLKKHRSFMAEDELWDTFRRAAEFDGKTASEALRDLIEQYNRRYESFKARAGKQQE